jgi:phosphatidylinositol alpha-mannosyltransferase
VPPKDSQSLAQALISLLNNESLRQELGAKGRAKALDYGWERVARDVLDYYMRVLGEPPWEKKFPQSKTAPILV